MPAAGRPFIPALRFHWLTSLYDPVVRLTTREATFKESLLRQARLRAGEAVLDVGCGTGTLAIAALAHEPGASVTGLDADDRILALARRKAAQAGAEIRFEQALADQMPFADAQFDVVLSSLFFHHLATANKRATLREIARVLKPGGRLHVADWGAPQNTLMRLAFQSIRLFDGYATTADSIAGRLPQLMGEAGLQGVEHTRNFATIFGTLALYCARKVP
jgi:ubiquinone/menaquinone biosynthesis C-methylase UbiE